MNPKRPILRYHGGKWKLAPWIISLMPPHRIYVEPFGGAASVLMRKDRSYAEVYNDQWDTVVNVFRVMRDPEKAERLRFLLELTPFSRAEFMETSTPSEDDIELARKTILRSFAGFGSASTNTLFSTGFRAASNRSGTTPAHDWEHFPEGITSYVERLRGAQKWVGAARYHYGSFYVWGDVPALMPKPERVAKVAGFRFDGESHGSFQSAAVAKMEGCKTVGMNWSNRSLRGQDFTRIAGNQALYADRDSEGTKQHGSGHIWYRTGNGSMSSKSNARKMASAMIAKIPFPLSSHIARCFKPIEK